MNEPNRGLVPDFDPDDVIKIEVIEHQGASNDRSAARQIALQVLYEVDSAGHPIGEVLGQQLPGHDLSQKSLQIARRLATGVVENRARLDNVVQRYAPEWPLDQVAIIDRNILRMAIYELCVLAQVPDKVVIDEAVELAKMFGAEGTPRFVNGVLGALMVDLDTLDEDFYQGDEDLDDVRVDEESDS